MEVLRVEIFYKIAGEVERVGLSSHQGFEVEDVVVAAVLVVGRHCESIRVGEGEDDRKDKKEK